MLVGGCQAGQALPDDFQRIGQGKPWFSAEPLFQRLALHKLHGEEKMPGVFTDGVDGHHVGMLDLGRRGGLRAKAADELLVLGQLRRNTLMATRRSRMGRNPRTPRPCRRGRCGRETRKWELGGDGDAAGAGRARAGDAGGTRARARARARTRTRAESRRLPNGRAVGCCRGLVAMPKAGVTAVARCWPAGRPTPRPTVRNGSAGPACRSPADDPARREGRRRAALAVGS